MAVLSHIVGLNARPFCNILCVEGALPAWQTAGMESNDKNGGPNHLRAWRMKRGMTQEQLAKEVGTSTNMIQYLESGERGLSAKWLRRLAPVLRTTSGMLLETDPDQIDIELHDLWVLKMTPDQRRQLQAIAEAIVKTGTDN